MHRLINDFVDPLQQKQTILRRGSYVLGLECIVLPSIEDSIMLVLAKLAGIELED